MKSSREPPITVSRIRIINAVAAELQDYFDGREVYMPPHVANFIGGGVYEYLLKSARVRPARIRSKKR